MTTFTDICVVVIRAGELPEAYATRGGGRRTIRAEMDRRSEHGFTLLELMIAVVIVAVLAAVAMPSFFAESRKTKSSSEVSAMFAELTTKEEGYKLDHNSYLTAAACPASPSSSLQDATGCIASGQPWSTLRVQLPEAKLYCSYAITTGAGGTTPHPPSPFTMSTPAASWYFIVATCDMDGSSAKNATYLINSLDTTIQRSNEGF
jgi:prepilin-type N-terminal cleavage/methylation domain-containing protein